MSIPIYEQEVLDGLEKSIAESKSFAFNTQLKMSDEFLPQIAELNKSFAKKVDERDLHPVDSLLASIGWNANDDVFLPEYTWAARNTPVDKPFNFMHNERDIIGHMTASLVVDDSNNIVDDETPLESIPEQFHIIVASVLYKHWEDPELQERMDKLIAEIKEDKWFVSMECLFRDFDYALIDGDSHKIIARNSDTSFLTKHLRFYGGSGEWDGCKLGRALKAFSFCGKGLVDNPANKPSIIFNKQTTPFNKIVFASVIQENNMADTNREQELSAQVDKLMAEKADLEKMITDNLNEAHAAEVKSLKDEIESLSNMVETNKSEASERNDKFAEVEKELAEAKAEISTLKEEIKKSEEAKLQANRVAQLVGVNVDADEAAKIAERWAQATAEQFDDFVNVYAKANLVPSDDDASDEENVDDTDSLESDLESAEASDNSEDIADLDSDENVEEQLEKSAASWLGSVLNMKEDK